MEKLDIIKTLQYFIKKIWLIMIIALLITFMGLAYKSLTADKKYTSTTTILVNTDNLNSANYSSQKHISLMSTYSELLNSKPFLEKVISDLELDVSTSEVTQNITVSYAENSAILNITVKDESSLTAKNIANSIAKNFIKEANNLLEKDDITVINEATEAGNIMTPFTAKTFIKFFIIGIILGISFVFVIYYFDSRIKDKYEVETYFNIPILGNMYKKDQNYNYSNIIKTNILRSIENNKTILLINSNPKTELSYVGYNLAASFANNNEKVLFIDANIKSPKNNNDVIIVEENLENVISNVQKTDTNNLYILKQNNLNFNEENLKLLIEKLENDYDHIIFIGQPINNSSISLILSTLVTSVILIATINKTKVEDIESSINSLKLINVNVNGIILNNDKGC